MRAFVYIMANRKHGVLYIGVTTALPRRIRQHQQGAVDGFTKKYRLTRLVYAEACERIDEAIAREKQLKRWHRDWKINLVESLNPDWNDLAEEILADPETSSG